MAVKREADARDRRAPPPPTQIRANEYFLPKDGIDREVITADICRYLGNDALVRPGTYEAMIADLKTDSQRWEQERRAAASRGSGTASGAKNTSNQSNVTLVGYTQSRTHESRQQWGPSGEGNSGYAPGLPPGGLQSGYDQYPQQSYPQSAMGAYGHPPQQSYIPQENHYIAGSNMGLEPVRGYAPPPGVEISRSGVPQYAPVPPSQQYHNQISDPGYGRGAYGHPPSFSSAHRPHHAESNFLAPISVATQSPYPEDRKPYYTQQGSAPTYGGVYDSRDSYNDRGYPESGPYNSSMPHPGAPPASNQHRRERELDMRDPRNHRDHGRRR